MDFIKFAIDDINVRPGLCSHQTDYVYNFENGFEDLDLENIHPLKSTAGTTYSPTYYNNPTYPLFDHTIGTKEGTYFLFRPKDLYRNSDFYQNSLGIMDLKGDASLTKCVRFAYQVTQNVTFRVFKLAEYEYNYDYEHRNSSMKWQSL